VLQLAEKAGVIQNDLRPCNFGLDGEKVLAFDLEDVVDCDMEDSTFLLSFKRSIGRLIL
jgi:hypothetical protein